MLLPALGRAKLRAIAAICMSNNKQLGLVWTMYAGDNSERLAINMDPRNNTQSPGYLYNGDPAWITGVIDWSNATYNTNADEVVNDKYALFGGYLARTAKVFACPSANYVGPLQRPYGWDHRVRSVAMNAAVGGGPKYPISNFGWNQSSWYVANKSSDFHTPGPSDVWVFTDEHPDSIDDGLMYTANYGVDEFTELPGSQHGGACGLCFADGHGLIYQWKGPVAANVPVIYMDNVGQPIAQGGRQRVPCSVTDPDMLYLAAHTPQN